LLEETGSTSKSSVTCKLCGGKFSRITWSHLKFSHNFTLGEYRLMFPSVPLTSEERYIEHSWDLAGREFSEDHRTALSLGDYERWARPGQKEARSEMMRELWETPYYVESTLEGIKQQLPISAREYRVRSRRQIDFYKTEKGLAARKRLSQTMKEYWLDPDYVAGQQKSRQTKPSQTELELLDCLEANFPGEWEYTGGLGRNIGGRFPDFTYTSRRKVIELFSFYWHVERARTLDDEADRLEHYKKYGYNCLVIWNDELWNEGSVVKKVREFTSG